MLSKKIITVIITAVLALSVGIGGTVLFFNSTDDSDKKDKDRTDTTSAEGGNADINDIIPGVLPEDSDEEETTAPGNESTDLSQAILGHWKDSSGFSGYDFYEGGKFDWTYVNLNLGGKEINGKASGIYTLEGDTLTLSYSIVAESITDVYTISFSNNGIILKNKENGNTSTYIRETADSSTEEVYADPQLKGKWLDSSNAYGYEFKANGVVTVYLFVISVEGYYSVEGDTVTIGYSMYGAEIGNTYTYTVNDNALTLTSDGKSVTYIKQ